MNDLDFYIKVTLINQNLILIHVLFIAVMVMDRPVNVNEEGQSDQGQNCSQDLFSNYSQSQNSMPYADTKLEVERQVIFISTYLDLPGNYLVLGTWHRNLNKSI